MDYTAAFIHADIDLPPDFDEMSKEEQQRQGVYVEMPHGFAKPGPQTQEKFIWITTIPQEFFQIFEGQAGARGISTST